MLGSPNVTILRPCFRIARVLAFQRSQKPHARWLTITRHVQCPSKLPNRHIHPWTSPLKSIRRLNSTQPTSSISRSSTPLKRNPNNSYLSRWRPSRLFSNSSSSISSFWKIISLARPERKPLLIAVGLLFVSSAVSMSIPFTIGRLIDFFASPSPVRIRSFFRYRRF